MKKWHPDLHKDNPIEAKEMAAAINEAYEILTNFCKSYQYDLSEASTTSQAQSPASWWESRFGHNVKQ